MFMNNALHEIVAVLDSSASVSEHKEEIIKTLRHFVKEQKKTKIGANLTLASYGKSYNILFENVSFDKVKFHKDPIMTGGVCPAVDCIAQTILDVGKRLSDTPEEERPCKVIVIMIITGRDNASKKYTYEQLREMISHQSIYYKWKFYLMTDFTINMEKLGIPEEDTYIIRRSEKTPFVSAETALCDAVSEYRNS